MVTKFNYTNTNGLVARTPDYSFTAIEDLADRLAGIDNNTVISSIADTTLKGESERSMIETEDAWFKVQSGIQTMDAERATLENKLANGDKNGNPLTPDMQNSIAARIAELKEGTITVDEVTQTPYTIALENRTDLEASNLYLTGLRGVAGAPTRPVASLDADKETAIRKELVRQKIFAQVGDIADLLADVSNALSPLIKKVNGQTITAEEQANIDQYVSRQATVTAILDADYNK